MNYAGTNVSSYIGMVGDSLRNTLPKAAVHCQVREAKRSLLDHFYTQIGKREVYLYALCDDVPHHVFDQTEVAYAVITDVVAMCLRFVVLTLIEGCKLSKFLRLGGGSMLRRENNCRICWTRTRL